MTGFKKNKAAPAPKTLNQLDEAQTAIADLTSVVNAHADEIDKLNGGITLAANTPGIIKSLSFLVPADAPWQSFVAGSGWDVGSPAAQFLKLPGGQILCRGKFTAKTVANAPSLTAGGTSVMTTLDAGIRPATEMHIPQLSANGGGEQWASLGLFVAGQLFLSAAGVGSSTVVWVDGLSWLAVDAAEPHQFSGGGWPIKVDHGFSKCNGLVVLGYRLQGQGGGCGAGTPHVDWQDLGDGTLRINGVWGLQWGKRYDLRLYLSPEDGETE
jgi:hypothetical protein